MYMRTRNLAQANPAQVRSIMEKLQTLETDLEKLDDNTWYAVKAEVRDTGFPLFNMMVK